MRSYSKDTAGEWVLAQYKNPDDGLLLPALNAALPPAHPMNWLDQRTLADTGYSGSSDINGRRVYVVAGRISLLPGPTIDEFLIPADNLRIYIDTESFQVLSIEVDHNILKSQRKDLGYQVMPGIVGVKTVETIEYSRHNDSIEIVLPELAVQ
jgi:hypothetical protein